MKYKAEVNITKWNATGIINDIRSKAADALNDIAQEAVDETKPRTPIETGELQASMRVIEHANSRKLEATWGSEKDYAFWVEVGSGGKAGAYMIRHGMQVAHPHLLKRLEGIL